MAHLMSSVRLAGISEIQDLLLRICRQRVVELTCREDFLEPVAELAEGDVWVLEDVEAWIAEHDGILADLFKAVP